MALAVGSLSLTGFVLGWSVAWPPGPINAEVIRRGLSRGVWPAYSVVLGGCLGDAMWALMVGLGADRLMRVARLQNAIAMISVGLLFLLGGFFLAGAWRRYYAVGTQEVRPGTSPKNSSRRSFILGFMFALTSPWNFAFWLAVIGKATGIGHGPIGAFVLAAGVVLGAATWGLILCAGVALFGARFARPSWEVFTQAVTGVVLIYFALHTGLQLIGAA